MAFHEQPGQAIFCAFSGDRIDGMCVLTPYADPSVSHRVQLGAGVLEGARGRGLGRELIQAGIDHALTLQTVDYVDGNALTSNERVLKLDLSVGFEIVGTIADFTRVDGESIGIQQLALDLRRMRRERGN